MVEQAQHAGQLVEAVQRGLDGGGRRARDGDDVALLDQVKDGAQRAGGVHVVVHAGDEALADGGDAVDELLLSVVELALDGAVLLQQELVVGLRVVQALQRRLALLDQLLREVERAAVVRGQHEVAHGLKVILLADLADGEEVARGLGHLLIVDVDEAVVHPVLGKGLAGRALGLGDLVFVVGEHQVLAAAVDVDGLAQVLHTHGGALDVPAGAALAERRLPVGLAGLSGLPQREVHRMLLVLVHLDARASLQILQVLAGELAVAAKGLGVKVDAVAALIGQALVHQLLHQRDDLGDVLGGLGVDGGLAHAQRLDVLEVLGDKALAQLLDGGALLVGAVDHLVVDVGEVLHERHVVAAPLQVPAQHVEHDERTRVADVNVVVDRRAAGVDAHLALVQGNQFFFSSRLRVIDPHRFSPSPGHSGGNPAYCSVRTPRTARRAPCAPDRSPTDRCAAAAPPGAP